MKRLLLALVLALSPVVALAQTSTAPGVVLRSRESSSNNGAVVLRTTAGDAAPGTRLAQASVVVTAAQPAPITASNGTTSAAAGAFTVALAANPNRLDCTIYSASAFSIAIGASPSAAQSIPVPAGGTFKCSSAAVVTPDQIDISSTAANAAYVVWAQ